MEQPGLSMRFRMPAPLHCPVWSEAATIRQLELTTLAEFIFPLPTPAQRRQLQHLMMLVLHGTISSMSVRFTEYRMPRLQLLLAAMPAVPRSPTTDQQRRKAAQTETLTQQALPASGTFMLHIRSMEDSTGRQRMRLRTLRCSAAVSCEAAAPIL